MVVHGPGQVDQAVAELVQGPLGQPGGVRAEPGQPVLERAAARLDESVRVEHHRRVRGQRGHRVGTGAGQIGAEQHARAALEEVRPAVVAHHQRRRVARVGPAQPPGPALGAFEAAHHHGRHRGVADVPEGAVQAGDHGTGRGLLTPGEGAQHIADLGHVRGGGQIVPDHVADHHRHRAVRQREGVVPVPAHLRGVRGRFVAGADIHAEDLRHRRQQVPLHVLGDPALALVELGVVHRETRPAGDVVDQGQIGRAERPLLVGAADGERADDPPAGAAHRPQRGDHRRVHAGGAEEVLLDLGERGVRRHRVVLGAHQDGGPAAQRLGERHPGGPGGRGQRAEELLHVDVLAVPVADHGDPAHLALLADQVDHRPVRQSGHDQADQRPQRLVGVQGGGEHGGGLGDQGQPVGHVRGGGTGALGGQVRRLEEEDGAARFTRIGEGRHQAGHGDDTAVAAGEPLGARQQGLAAEEGLGEAAGGALERGAVLGAVQMVVGVAADQLGGAAAEQLLRPGADRGDGARPVLDEDAGLQGVEELPQQAGVGLRGVGRAAVACHVRAPFSRASRSLRSSRVRAPRSPGSPARARAAIRGPAGSGRYAGGGAGPDAPVGAGTGCPPPLISRCAGSGGLGLGGVHVHVLLAGQAHHLGHHGVGHRAQDVAVAVHALVAGELHGGAEADGDPAGAGQSRAAGLELVGADHGEGDDRGAGHQGQPGDAGAAAVQAAVGGAGALRVDAEDAAVLQDPAAGHQRGDPAVRAVPVDRDHADAGEEPGHQAALDALAGDVLVLADEEDLAFADQRQDERVDEGEVVAGEDHRTVAGDVLRALHPRAEHQAHDRSENRLDERETGQLTLRSHAIDGEVCAGEDITRGQGSGAHRPVRGARPRAPGSRPRAPLRPARYAKSRPPRGPCAAVRRSPDRTPEFRRGYPVRHVAAPTI
ncbi:hypothetical protein DUI70_6251 [Streptomyces albus]|nr:hypothetical protein DUI70_6251 [Streptomyces albus]